MSEPTRPIPKRRSGVVVPVKLKWHQHLLAWVVYWLLRALSGTWRCHWDDSAKAILQDPAQNFVIGTWHNRLAVSMTIYHRYFKRHNSSPLAALISASGDGGLLATVLKRFGVQAARGSSSRRGAQALVELRSWMDKGYHVAITPDGPRGPCYAVHDGIITLAQVTGKPIIPVSSHIHWKYRPRSWDRFQIPLPFSRCDIRIGEPLKVPRELSPEEREKLREELRARLLKMTTD